MRQQLGSVIGGTGMYVPPKLMTNDDMARILDTSDAWIHERTGIRQRYVAEPELGIATLEMAKQASLRALTSAEISAEKLGLVIVATITPEYRSPSTASMLQHELGAKNAGAFDLAAACSGSLYALSIADRFVSSGVYKNVLVVGAEALSTVIDWTDRNTAVLFGDGASAAVVKPSASPSVGFQHFLLHSDGSHYKNIWIKGGGSREPMTHLALENREERLVMNGRETYKFASRALAEVSQNVLAKTGLTTRDVQHVVAHQANLRIIESVAERLEIPLDRFIINIDRYANTSAASLLTTFHEGSVEGRFKSGDIILMIAIGASYTWGASIYRVP